MLYNNNNNNEKTKWTDNDIEFGEIVEISKVLETNTTLTILDLSGDDPFSFLNDQRLLIKTNAMKQGTILEMKE